MSEHERLENARRKMIRYRLLKILDAGRLLPVGEGLISQILVDADLVASQSDIRKSLQYLCDKGYVVVDKPNPGIHWTGRLLPKGVDYLENPEIDDLGISRPVEP